MPQVSVVIPTYNRVDLLPSTLDSVLAQTFHDLEAIVVDDGSTDGTEAVVAAYVDRWRDRVRYLRQENAGQASARNTGIRAARGRYIALVDSDDLWLPSKVERQVAHLESHPELAWVYCDVEVFDHATGRSLGRYAGHSKPYEGDVASLLLLRNFIASPSPMIRVEVFQQVGLFDEDQGIRNREDWEMWLRIAARYPVGYVPEALARLRRHSTNATATEDPEWRYQSHLLAIQKATAAAPGTYAQRAARALSEQHCFGARNRLVRGDAASARRLYLAALRLHLATPEAYLGLLLSLGGPSVVKAARLLTQSARSIGLSYASTRRSMQQRRRLT